MSISVWLKAIALWAAILVIAITNGTIREKSIVPAIGSFWGTFASGIMLSVGIFIVALLTIRWYGVLESRSYWAIGVLWLLLTLLFEFSFGLLVAQRSWEELFEPYMFRGGNIWPVVLAVTFLSPWLAARVRGLV